MPKPSLFQKSAAVASANSLPICHFCRQSDLPENTPSLRCTRPFGARDTMDQKPLDAIT
ncbi:MAG TPA: hypothetical protein VKV19_05240 [Ktedonobacteraceae bacterium]|nr:hypothetical protein [Ktedonobacteraceae bacterium]